VASEQASEQVLAAKAKTSGKTRTPRRPSATARDARGASVARVLRIIGGTHRGRKLRFPEGVEIRPTPDRVRETLFNWLMTKCAGARVLDLFAGSGALGLEALSRGAAHVTFIEQDRRAATAIRTVLTEWQLPNAEIHCMDALGFLKTRGVSAAPFDVVFVDPPYASSLASAAAHELDASGSLAPDARIYLETPSREALPDLPATWKPMREGRAGEVGYHLFAS
jgi:16S rRNA (guanine966-N2)-methyltransferase